ncbi:MAG: phosphate-starvation-inducible PsiE family protein [Candidatus Competibacterales bacterium]
MSIVRFIDGIEKSILLLIVLLTVGAVLLEVLNIVQRANIVIADILLLFLYTEVLSMVAVFYQSRTVPVIYPLFIAITALSRLIVLQSKEMDPYAIVFEATAILLLAVAVLLLRHADVSRLKTSQEEPGSGLGDGEGAGVEARVRRLRGLFGGGGKEGRG